MGKNENVEVIYDGLNFDSGKNLSAQRDARAIQISLLQLLNKVNEDIATAPFACVHSAEKVNSGAAGNAAVGDLDRVAIARFPSLVGQGNEDRETAERG